MPNPTYTPELEGIDRRVEAIFNILIQEEISEMRLKPEKLGAFVTKKVNEVPAEISDSFKQTLYFRILN